MAFLAKSVLAVIHTCKRDDQTGHQRDNSAPFTKDKVRHNADLALESCIQQDLWHSLGLMCFSESCC